MRERARERRGRTEGEVRESRGGRGVVRGIETRRGGQAGRRAGGVARWRTRAPATLPSLCQDEDDRGERRAGPPAGWAGQLDGLHREEPR